MLVNQSVMISCTLGVCTDQSIGHKYVVLWISRKDSRGYPARGIASYPDLPAHTQTFTCNYFLSHQKAERSCRFGDVMMMSPGCGSEECLDCE